MKLIYVCAVSVALVGCNQYWERKDEVTFGAGDAVSQNIAMQRVHSSPNPDTNIPMNNAKAVEAYARYRCGQVKITTSKLASTTSSGEVVAGNSITQEGGCH